MSVPAVAAIAAALPYLESRERLHIMLLLLHGSFNAQSWLRPGAPHSSNTRCMPDMSLAVLHTRRAAG